MKDIVLYCKSYRRDFLRLERLLKSIEKFNQNRIPFYISTPSADKDELIRILGDEGSYLWVSDEEIVRANPKASIDLYKELPGGLSQAIVKSEFWRLGISENYLCLDSDCVFIKPFSISDFIADDGVPYTVLHQNKEYFQLASDRGEDQVLMNLRSEARRVQALFQEFLHKQNINIWDLISPDYPETLIYGEALMKYRAIPLIAIEPLFRVYHYSWQYFLMRRLGETEEKLKLNFLGIIYQSNWESGLNNGESIKSIPSRLNKSLKTFFRYLQSYL